MGGISVVTSVLLALLVVEGIVALDPIKDRCSKVECPNYRVIETNSLYEVRRYSSSVWISTDASRSPVSFIQFTMGGVLKLKAYFNGKNGQNKVLKRSAPTLTKVHDMIWPSLLTVSRYLPAENHANPPTPANGLNVNNWRSPTFAVVKQVQGIVSDYTVAQEAASLRKSLEGSIWEKIIKISGHPSTWNAFSVALYDPIISSQIMTNYEIWITFELKAEDSIKTF